MDGPTDDWMNKQTDGQTAGHNHILSWLTTKNEYLHCIEEMGSLEPGMFSSQFLSEIKAHNNTSNLLSPLEGGMKNFRHQFEKPLHCTQTSLGT